MHKKNGLMGVAQNAKDNLYERKDSLATMAQHLEPHHGKKKPHLTSF